MIEIIPAIDVIEGKCVRLTQGDYAQKSVYDHSPFEMALQYEDIGIKRLHMVDLDGAKAGTVKNLKALEQIASRTELVIDFGGGIKNDVSINDVFNAGASIATIGSIAVKEPSLFSKWLSNYGADNILLGADVKDEMIMVSGWLEKTDLTIDKFIESKVKDGLTQYFCTDISKDGVMEGPSMDLYKMLKESLPKIDLIASGGVRSLDDVLNLNNIGCTGVIIGKAIYEYHITMPDLKNFIKKHYAN